MKKLLTKLRRQIPSRKKSLRSLRRRRGFTILELMVVLVILGTLMTILIANLSSPSDKVDKVVHTANKAAIEGAMFRFKTECGRLPRAEEGLNALVEGPADIEACAGKSFLKKNQIMANNCAYKYEIADDGSYQIIWLGADCAEGGDGANADIALDKM